MTSRLDPSHAVSGSPNVPLAPLAPSTYASPTYTVPKGADATQNVPMIMVHGVPSSHSVAAETITNINRLSFKRDPPIAKGHYYTTQVDIIGVPAIGGHPEKTWASKSVFPHNELVHMSSSSTTVIEMIKHLPVLPAYSVSSPVLPNTGMQPRMEKIEPAWITNGIRTRDSEARVLLYDHGEPEDGDTLKTLASRLLRNIEDLRRIEKEDRPLFFVCHSTGGLVLKMALAEAHRYRNPILGDCYGVTFFSTPHRGSSYLSRPEFSNTVAEIMKWSAPLPESISEHLQLDHHLLRTLDSEFKGLATEFQVWSFFETEDTDFSNEFHAPMTSVKSALLNLRHEIVYPLLSDHANCASFGVNNLQTRESYLNELSAAIKKSILLSTIRHTEMNLEDRVKVEINGFYETSNNEASMKVWSTSRSLRDLKRYGPEKLLEDRISESSAPPKEKQYVRSNTRAPSFRRKEPGATSPAANPNTTANPPNPGLGTKTRSFFAGKTKGKQLQDTKSQPRSQENDLVIPGIVPRLHVDAHPNTPPEESANILAAPQAPALSLSETSLADPDHPRPRISQYGGSLGVKHQRSDLTNTSVPNAFTKPDVSQQKHMWIHVPFNNPIWVKDVLSAISVEKGRDCKNKLLSIENWDSKHVRGRHAEHHGCFLKPGCALIDPDFGKPMSPMSSHRKELGLEPNYAQLYLYLPYLHFDTYKALVKRRTLIKRRIKQGRSRPVPQSVAKLDSLESKVIWQFLGHDPPLNCRRTLDQFGYPSLLDTRARDDDQMLYKMTKQRFSHGDDVYPDKTEEKQRLAELEKEANSDDESYDSSNFEEEEEEEEESEPEEDENDILDGNVLMVDQLWLWIVDSSTTVTFFPKKEPLMTDGRLFQQADLRNSIFNEVNADLTSQCENAYDLAALATLHAVTVLLERSSHPDLEIFRTFEEAISILTEKMTTSFKRFRARGFRDKTSDGNDTLRAHNIRAKHKQEGALAEKQNQENTSALLELRDIEDELHTLEELFDAQRKAIELMIKCYEREELKSMTTNGLAFLAEAEEKLDEYSGQVRRMIDDVKGTREDFDKLLQMIQRQAQVDEVRLQRLQADLASAQSRSVMIFTIFTVIFLPLTFFTGLFGMNTQEWGGDNNLHLRTIGSITLPSSFAIITITLILAWSTRTRKLSQRIALALSKISKSIRGYIISFLFYIPAAATFASKEARKKAVEKRREAKRLKKEEKRQASWFDEDFWESHVAARDKDYTVPAQNRKSVILARMKRLEEAEMKNRFNFYTRSLGLGIGEENQADPYAKRK